MAGTLIDQRRAELADALSAEYQARLAPVRDKRGEANAQIVRISNQPERTEEDFDRLNELHDHARAMDALLFKIAEHLATMQTALFRKSADELAKFDPTYGWPEASA